MFDQSQNTINLFKKHIGNGDFHVLGIDPLYENNLINVKKSIDKNRAKILIVNMEPNFFHPKHKVALQYIELKDLLLKYKIFNCDFYITCYFNDFCHNETINYLNENSYDWRFHKFYIDAPCIAGNTLDAVVKLDIENQNLNLKNCTMKFSHLNFVHRMHRQLFSKFLIKEKLYKNNLVNINASEGKPTSNIKFKNKVLGIPFNHRTEWFYNKKFLDLWRDVPLKYIQHPDTTKNMGMPYLQFLQHASFNIVSETVFDYPFPYYTEKTVQPILCKRPFIMIGPAGNLKNLKAIGFKTFSNYIDESYDNIEDPNERLEAIMELVLSLDTKSHEELKEMVSNMKNTLLHNYTCMLKKIKHFTNSKN